MLESRYAALRGLSPFVAIALVVIFVFCGQLFERRRADLGDKTLDACWSCSPADMKTRLESLGESGRHQYAMSELTLDVLFPLTYGLLLAILIVQLFPQPAGRFLILLPLGAALFDLLENGSIAFMALTFGGQESTLAGITRIFIRTKFILFAGSLVAVILGVGLGLRSSLPKRRR